MAQLVLADLDDEKFYLLHLSSVYRRDDSLTLHSQELNL
jgi:hypothetical protein